MHEMHHSNQLDVEVIRALKDLYKEKLLPIERTSHFHKFHQSEILDAELSAKPTVLLVGQYSTGKTTFIRHLIQMDYPEIHIGPEPTTDRFIAVVHGPKAKTIKGNALTTISDLPFSGLSTFGTSFLNKFSAAVVPAPLLAHMNIIDTPGVLSGEKQRTSRGYDFAQVARWFAERSDLILLMFDCSKLDISDEFKSVIEQLQPHEDKVHCVLNKADQLDTESLMRVYGALLWSMGRIFKGAEVARIYVGSFQDKPLERAEHALLFHKDEQVLKNHLKDLPKACSMRKVNEMVKRIRLNIVHHCILGHLRKQMPWVFGQKAAQARLIDNLQEVYEIVKRDFEVSEGDFPKIDEFKAKLRMADFYTFPHSDSKILNVLQDLRNVHIPKISEKLAGSSNDGADGEPKARRQQPKLFTLTEPKKNNLILYIVLLAVFLLLVTAAIVYMVVYKNDKSSAAYTLTQTLLVQLDDLKEQLTKLSAPVAATSSPLARPNFHAGGAGTGGGGGGGTGATEL